MTGKQDAGWTDYRLARMKTLWAEGLTAADIAKDLGGGLTRCAVLGKVHRLGLRKRPIEVFQTQPVPKVKKTKMAKPKPPPPPAPEPVAAPTPAPRLEAKPMHLTLSDLPSSGCKWPYGSGPFTFCGDRRVGEGPYCKAHSQHARGVNTWGGAKRSSSGADLARSLRRYL